MATTKRPRFLLLIIPVFLLFVFVAVRNRTFLRDTAHQTNGKETVTRTGIALVTKANDITGPLLTVTDPPSLRRFETVLPPTFRDENGTYPGALAGESVVVRLGMSETLDEDRTRFRALPNLDSFDETSLGPWHLIVAKERTRWVARATVEDSEQTGKMVHAIECLSAPSSSRAFWEGCKAMITNARITIVPGNALTK